MSDDLQLEWTCELTSGDSADTGCDGDHSVQGERDGEFVFWRVKAIHGVDGLSIDLLEISGTDDEQTFTGPEKFSIEVLRDGASQIRETIEPEYVYNMPNAPCGPTCGGPKDPVSLHIPA